MVLVKGDLDGEHLFVTIGTIDNIRVRTHALRMYNMNNLNE